MKRKIISSLGVSVLAFNILLATPIFANEYETNLEIQNEARYTHIDKASSNLKISGGVATVSASMTANPGISKTLITSRLQKKVNGRGKQYNHGQRQVILFPVDLIKLNQFQKEVATEYIQQ